MNIAVYVPSLLRNPASNFVVETFFPLFEIIQDHRVLLITEVSIELRPVTRLETIIIRAQPKNPLLKRLWIERTVARLLKNIKADLFISADKFCSLKTVIPQFIVMPDRENIKPAYARKAQLLIVTSGQAKKELVEKLKIREDKIAIVYPPPGKEYTLPDTQRRESIKMEYSECKEYFLCNTSLQKQEKFIDLLKSFSYFKKRQQSSFKLLIIGNKNSSLEKNIENYKYRNDVVMVRPGSLEEKAAIIAAAYALIVPFDTDEDIPLALDAAQSGVPVITTRDSPLSEIAGDAVLYCEKEIKDVGEKMMQLYKDEVLRSQLIEKGAALVKNFTIEKSANQLWQSIMKAAN